MKLPTHVSGHFTHDYPLGIYGQVEMESRLFTLTKLGFIWEKGG